MDSVKLYPKVTPGYVVALKRFLRGRWEPCEDGVRTFGRYFPDGVTFTPATLAGIVRTHMDVASWLRSLAIVLASGEYQRRTESLSGDAIDRVALDLLTPELMPDLPGISWHSLASLGQAPAAAPAAVRCDAVAAGVDGVTIRGQRYRIVPDGVGPWRAIVKIARAGGGDAFLVFDGPGNAVSCPTLASALAVVDMVRAAR